MTVNYLLYNSRAARKARAAAAANAHRQGADTPNSSRCPSSSLEDSADADGNDTFDNTSDSASGTSDDASDIEERFPPPYIAPVDGSADPPPYEVPSDSLSEAVYEYEFDEEAERAELEDVVANSPRTFAEELALKRESARKVHRAIYSQATMLRYKGRDPAKICEQVNVLFAQSPLHGPVYEVRDALQGVGYDGADSASTAFTRRTASERRIKDKRVRRKERERKRKEKQKERRDERERERAKKSEAYASTALCLHRLFNRLPDEAAYIVGEWVAEL